MARQRVSFRVTAGPEFHTVGVALRAVDSALPRQLRKAMRDAVKPYIGRAQRRVRSTPVRGRAGTTGLRREIARGVKLRVGLGRNHKGAFMRVTTSMTRPDASIIPRGFDRARGWRHPVFGHQDRWVRQEPLRPGWFIDTLDDSREPIEQALTDVLEHARDQVAAAGGTPRPGF